MRTIGIKVYNIKDDGYPKNGARILKSFNTDLEYIFVKDALEYLNKTSDENPWYTFYFDGVKLTLDEIEFCRHDIQHLPAWVILEECDYDIYVNIKYVNTDENYMLYEEVVDMLFIKEVQNAEE